jgi:hypothetical protein
MFLGILPLSCVGEKDQKIKKKEKEREIHGYQSIFLAFGGKSMASKMCHNKSKLRV